MANQSLVQVRIDSQLKKEVTSICEMMGIDLSTAIRIFMQRVKLEKGLPFALNIPEGRVTRYEGMMALDDIRSATNENPMLTQEEINAEIKAARNAIKERTDG